MSKKGKAFFMKKTLYMVAASLLLFFVFAYIDEYETLILPLLKDEAKPSTIEAGADFTDENLVEFLGSFNEQLSAAYSASNPGKAWELPATPQLQRAIHDELVYNLNNNIRVESRVSDLVILTMEALSPGSGKVVALETTDRGQDGSSKSAVAYVVEKGEKGFLVTAMETVEGGEKERGAAR